MSLRLKLLLALVPLGLALVVVGVSAVWSLSALGTESQLILSDNYRSVLAAQRMQEAIERLDRAALLLILGRPKPAASIGDWITRFEKELKVQEGNITEPDEEAATQNLRNVWHAFVEKLQELQGIADREAAESYYIKQLEPTLDDVRKAASRILDINQDAMLEKSDRAEHFAATTNRALTVTTLAALAIGATISIGLTNRLLRPLGVLNQAVGRLGTGDFDVRAKVAGRDEIAQLADQFNSMADRLVEYRNSSLGELLLAQQAAQAAIDSIPDPVILFSGDGGILKINDAAAALVQKPHAGEVDMLATLPPELRVALEQARSYVLEGKGPYIPSGFEDAIAITDAGDNESWFLLRATPVYEQRGRINGVTVILQDVTRLRRFDELKDDLVATVAHEFRTPLTSLRMAIHLVLEGVAGPLSEKQGDLLFAARDDCQRLQRTVDELLDLARIQSGKLSMQPRPLRAADLVHQAIELHRGQADEKQVTLTADVGLGLDQVLADPQRVQLVLSNLLGNAIRHSPDGGDVEISLSPKRGNVRFSVKDHGEGIPAEYHAAIFERFFRVPGAKSGAAGLGLPLAKEVVESHGGRIGVDSQVGQGSTFWFTLPMAPS
ncbi:MAG TPA: ATP-binding protein [Pirellulales bacterium]|jgi:signal transduction histidine kinase|nr:ATP-binding protein [Pirellulales bacterium]